METKLVHVEQNGNNPAEKKENNSLTINELKVNVYENIYGNGRLECPICIFKGNGKIPTIKQVKPIEKSTFKAFLPKLKTGEAANIEKAANLKTAYKDDKKGYDEAKQNLEAFVIGMFDHRTDNTCLIYVPLLCLDIDGYNDQLEASWDFEQLKKNPLVFAAWYSPSGCGLRVLVWTNATPETHKPIYKTLQSEFCTFLNLTTDKEKFPHMDNSTSNMSRLWFYTETDDIYLNVESKAFFTPSVVATIEKPSEAKPTATKQRPHTNEPLTDTQKLEACAEMVTRRNHNDGRNNFVFRLACLANEHSVSNDSILNYCLDTYQAEDFTKAEIQKTVTSAVKRTQYGKFSDAQLMQYLKNGSPSVVATIEPKVTPSVKKAVPPTATTNETDDNDDDDDYSENKKTPKITLVKRYLSKTKDFRFNEILIRPEVSPKGKNQFEAVNVADLYCELLEKARLNGIKEILDNLLKSSFIPKFNPIKDYFENNPMKWDESQPDYIDNLASYVKAKDKFWFNTQYKKALVRTVACGLGIIKFNKHCFTLIGGQNAGKSSYIRFHAETPFLKQYYKENPE